MTTMPKAAKGLLHAICDRLSQEKFRVQPNGDQLNDSANSSHSADADADNDNDNDFDPAFGRPLQISATSPEDADADGDAEVYFDAGPDDGDGDGDGDNENDNTEEGQEARSRGNATKPKRQKRSDGTWRRKYVRSSVVSADISTLDSSRYIQKFASWDDCGIEQCRNGIVGREHFHCASPECDNKLFTKKDDMLRHCKWHYRKDEAKAFGFLRFCPTDDCSALFGSSCEYNRKQTHYHCEQDNCKKVYVSTSDVQIHSSYHKKMADLLSIGFQRFRGTDQCGGDPWCPYAVQRTAHYHCIREGCQHAYKNKADLEKHRHCHDRENALLSDGFRKFSKRETRPLAPQQYSTPQAQLTLGVQPQVAGSVPLSTAPAPYRKRKHAGLDEDEPPTQIRSNVLANEHVIGSSVWTPVRNAKMPLPDAQPNAVGLGVGVGSAGAADSDSESGQLVVDTKNVLTDENGSSEPSQSGQLSANGQKMRSRDETWKSYLKRYTANDPCTPHCEFLYKDHYHCVVRGCSQFFRQKESVREHARLHQRDDRIMATSFRKFEANCNEVSCRQNDVHYHCIAPNCKFVTNLADPPLTCMKHHDEHDAVAPYINLHGVQITPVSMPNQSIGVSLGVGVGAGSVATTATSASSSDFVQPIKKRRGRPPKYLRETQMMQQPVKIDPPCPPVAANLNLLDFARSLSAVINNVSAAAANATLPQQIQSPAPAPAVAPSKTNATQRPPSASEAHVDELTMEHFVNAPNGTIQQFKMFQPMEKCPDDKCPFIGQQHFHCLRERCHHSSVRLDLLNLHFRSFHSLIRIMEGFEFFDRNVQCRRAHCPNSKVNAHFHCTKPRCDYSFVRYSTMPKHSRKHAESEKSSGPAPGAISSTLPNGAISNGTEDKAIKAVTPDSGLGVNVNGSSNGVVPQHTGAEAEAAMRTVLQLISTGTFSLADPALRGQVMQQIGVIQGWCNSLASLLQASKTDDSTASQNSSHANGELQSQGSAFTAVLRSHRSAAEAEVERNRARNGAERAGRASRMQTQAFGHVAQNGAPHKLVVERPLNLPVHE